MITPSYGLTATERVLPRMALDFTTASLDSRVTFTRTGNTATVTNSSGVIVGINADLPRFDYNPTTLVCNGLLIEESRTNLLLNSLINGVSLVTQLVTTTAVAHTLSFYGTGTIVLTGTSSATVVGTGAYPSRRTLTFTPTAGVLTVTVTGTVQFAQLEVGAFATSYIPTAASQVTRTADVATMTGTNFSSWYNQTQGTIYSEWTSFATINTTVCVLTDDISSALAAQLLIQSRNANTQIRIWQSTAGGGLDNFAILSSVTGQGKATVAYVNNTSFAGSANAGAVVSTGVTPQSITANALALGANPGGLGQLDGYLKKVMYWPQRLINAEIQAFSK